VYAFIARRIRNREEAQDLTSDVFHQALANLGRFKWRGVPFAAWLFRIAANVIAKKTYDRAEEVKTTSALPTLARSTGQPGLDR